MCVEIEENNQAQVSDAKQSHSYKPEVDFFNCIWQHITSGLLFLYANVKFIKSFC